MKQSGFTLLELVVTLMIIGVLAVAVLPRFAERSAFDRLGFYDQTLSVLRYAQKTAIAQRRNVCVDFTSTTVTLKIASTAGSAVACTIDLAGPTRNSPPAGINFTNAGGVAAIPANFVFNALGEASSGQTFRVSGISKNR
jgi:MSHA pilin protein MshC